MFFEHEQSKRLNLIISQIIIFLFSTRNAFAISKIERMLKNHPVKFSFIIFGVCGVFVGVLLLLSYYKAIFRTIRSLITDKKKAPKRTKIPTGKFENRFLPNARLIVNEAQEKAREFLITPRKEFWIGRDEDNQLILEDETISRKHAKIRPGEKGYVLYDMLSRNGTYVNRKKIKGYVLENGDLISMGSYTLIFDEEGQELKRAVAVDSAKIYYKDKREYIRLPVDTEVHIKIYDVLDFDFERIKGRLKDIGEGGVCFRTPLAIPELAVIKLEIVLPEDTKNITATGKVVWIEYDRAKHCYELGVRFLEIKDEYRRHIIEHINGAIHNYIQI